MSIGFDPSGFFRSDQGAALAALFLVVILAFVPTGIVLNAGPWQTEQEGHGPFLMAAAGWFALNKRDQLLATEFNPAPVSGWVALLASLALFYLGRTQEILAIETFSIIPMLVGIVLLTGGWSVLRVLAFPIGLLVFTVPPPGWLMDAITLPLKAFISDVVTRLVYKLGYPIAQNGVVIMIGPYQLLVKDACAGMNSIFALSAIGVIYIYIMEYPSRLRNLIILLSILPITIAANFVRVLMLVLIAYHFGTQAVESLVHDVTGVVLFAVAFAILVGFDGVLAALLVLWRRLRRTSRPAQV